MCVERWGDALRSKAILGSLHSAPPRHGCIERRRYALRHPIRERSIDRHRYPFELSELLQMMQFGFAQCPLRSPPALLCADRWYQRVSSNAIRSDSARVLCRLPYAYQQALMRVILSEDGL